jgi:putative Holliday junction resolvase
MAPVTYLGFDYGSKHIGVAVGGTGSGLAQPVGTVSSKNTRVDWPGIDRLLREWQPAALVVGLPLNMDDSENAMTREARRFGEALRQRYNLPVHWVDERLTSVTARQALTEAGVAPKRLKQHVDRLAAQTILQAFLDEAGRPTRETS